MCEVYYAYDKKKVATFPTREAAESWIANEAIKSNYGICRTWTMNGWDYFDVGPTVYIIKHDAR